MKAYHLQENGDHHEKQIKPDSDGLNDMKIEEKLFEERAESREEKTKAGVGGWAE